MTSRDRSAWRYVTGMRRVVDLRDIGSKSLPSGGTLMAFVLRRKRELKCLGIKSNISGFFESMRPLTKRNYMRYSGQGIMWSRDNILSDSQVAIGVLSSNFITDCLGLLGSAEWTGHC